MATAAMRLYVPKLNLLSCRLHQHGVEAFKRTRRKVAHCLARR